MFLYDKELFVGKGAVIRVVEGVGGGCLVEPFILFCAVSWFMVVVQALEVLPSIWQRHHSKDWG